MADNFGFKIGVEGEISILVPEVILLYKSLNSKNSDYQYDYNMVINKLDKERYDCFVNVIKWHMPKVINGLSKNPINISIHTIYIV
ncbi:hypothetical protein [Lutispora thermophila]|uniref:Uncharacterized protein n=1 Tax=Lutispora thermophila DSM 19022 TaxID=1122184 RepID=A0A1M6CJA4_9FIRM|nr:hypothetical protein [Lutispora thermophila]SHI61077.1 hypothetical protein SAMN02745176_00807 [Lutispora thermophila DSM 19022]